MYKKIITLTGMLTLSLWCVLGLSPADADFSPGVFVLSPEGEAETINNWAQEGYILFDILIDTNNDGRINTIFGYTFDTTEWRLKKLEIDDNNNDIIDSAKHYYYNQAGNIERIEIDSDNNGEIDEVIIYYYNTDYTIDYQKIDKNYDGATDKKITFVYENGKLVRKLTDHNYDDQIDSVTEYEYFQDFLHQKTIGKEYDFENKELINPYYLERYDYEEETGNIIELFVNDNYDDYWDSLSTFIYDDEGRLMVQAIDHSHDGNYDEIVYYAWLSSDNADDSNDTSDNPSASCFIDSLR